MASQHFILTFLNIVIVGVSGVFFGILLHICLLLNGLFVCLSEFIGQRMF